MKYHTNDTNDEHMSDIEYSHMFPILNHLRLTSNLS